MKLSLHPLRKRQIKFSVKLLFWTLVGAVLLSVLLEGFIYKAAAIVSDAYTKGF